MPDVDMMKFIYAICGGVLSYCSFLDIVLLSSFCVFIESAFIAGICSGLYKEFQAIGQFDFEDVFRISFCIFAAAFFCSFSLAIGYICYEVIVITSVMVKSALYREIQRWYVPKIEVKDPSWDELVAYLDNLKTKDINYNSQIYDVKGFAMTFRDNARQHGIRCAYVAVGFQNANTGHALNAFKTDIGTAYIDVIPEPKIVYLKDWKPYSHVAISSIASHYMDCSGNPADFWKGVESKPYSGSVLSYAFYEFQQSRKRFLVASRELHALALVAAVANANKLKGRQRQDVHDQIGALHDQEEALVGAFNLKADRTKSDRDALNKQRSLIEKQIKALEDCLCMASMYDLEIKAEQKRLDAWEQQLAALTKELGAEYCVGDGKQLRNIHVFW